VVHRDPGLPDRSQLPREERPAASHKHGLTARLARAIVWLRFVIVPAWIAAAVLASVSLPSLFEADTGELGNLLPRSSEALSVERRSGEIFATPLLSHSLVVASRPGGLSVRQQAAAARYVLAVDQSANSTLRAVPLTNAPGLAVGPAGTTLVAFTYTNPYLATSDREEATHRFAGGLAKATGAPAAYVTGTVPASAQQTHLGEDWLPWLELATVLVVVGVLALYFRALGVPLLGLVTVGIAYLCASHALGWAGLRYDVSIPQEVNPVIVALLFGILTDYVVFFVSGYRRRLAEGDDSLQAVTETTAELLPVIATASLMIAGATLTLLVSGVRFLAAFGPGNSVAVLIAAAVALTFVPAVLAIFGPRLLWPGRSHRTERPAEEGARGHIVGAAAAHPAVVAALCILVLGAAATGVREMALGNPVIRGLPASNPAHRGYADAVGGFGPGIVGPTALVLEGNGVAAKRGALTDLQRRLSGQPGVAAVLGPADQPLQARYGAMLAQSGDAARYVLVLEDDPNGTEATATLANLESRLPAMLAASGLGAAKAGIAGDTAIAAELNDATQQAFLRIAPLAIAVLLFLLWVLLRSRGAPLYLVGVSALVVLAALGLTVYVFQDLLGYGELVFFVPVATAILLLALGSDYNVFLVSRIWRESERRELRPAIRTAGARAGRAITIAGFTLALSFAVVAIIPLLAFRELAFAMAVGLILDTTVARTLLIPALVSLFESDSRLARHAEEANSPAPAGG
jgi:putative drug exporter of the RND superfamily